MAAFAVGAAGANIRATEITAGESATYTKKYGNQGFRICGPSRA